MLANIELDILPVPRISVFHAEIPKTSVPYDVQKVVFETVDIKMVKWVIIPVNKIGYML